MDKQKIIDYMTGHMSYATSLRELIRGMKIKSENRSAFRRLLKNLSKSGEIQKIKGGKYRLSGATHELKGLLSSHVKGFAFLIPEQGEKDVFIPRMNLNGGMHGDQVLCTVESISREGKPVGRVEKVLERNYSTITGVFQKSRGYGFVTPHDEKISYDFYIPVGSINNAKSGESVTVEIIKFPSGRHNPEGKVVEVLGSQNDPAVEVRIALEKFGIPSKFPTKVQEYAKKINQSVSEKSIEGRLDLREKCVITIDGETAKDFDDAVSIETDSNGFRLGIHIADVSHYISPGSPIDKEAMKRGTSVYFPDRVIPMLPFELSNNICSLKPGVDRLTLSVFIQFDNKGNEVRTEFFESVIRSTERMTYTDVAALLEGQNHELQKRYDFLLLPVQQMKDLMKLLQAERRKTGSIDFDFLEAFLLLNAQGRLEKILKSERNIAHRLIEEFMLAANKAVAKRLKALNSPTIYRVHDSPDAEKVGELSDFLHNFGCRLNPHNVSPLDFSSALASLKGKPEERLVSTVMLRHMKQARYSTENIGHFGLAFSDYTHFTSPIRRYPDLLVHRILREKVIRPEKMKKSRDSFYEKLPEITEQCSVLERRAEEAEREIVNLKKAQFMEEKVGEEYSGVISGITSFGIFVELDKIFVEGLIHVSKMTDDYYFFDEKRYSLIGEKYKRTFRIGDALLIEVWDVSVERREIDFRMLKKIGQ